jgi:hypothetical protein
MFSPFRRRILIGHNREEIPMKRIASILFFAVTVLGACGTPSTATSGNAPPTTTSRPTPTLPDLNDPAVRHRFVCSFAPGYFAISPPASLAVSTDCEHTNSTKP